MTFFSRFVLIGIILAVTQVQEVAANRTNNSRTASFWVSPEGSDSNIGTKKAPFLTLQRARDAVRGLPDSAFKNQNIYVFLRGGTYRLQQPLQLTVEDSGRNHNNVIYCSALDEYPVISGAIQVTGWTLHDPALGIYKAFVGPYRSRQLYVNGVRAQRAQTTPYPAGFLPTLFGGGIEFIPTNLNLAAWRDPSTWTNPQDIEAIIITQWKMMRVPISSIRAYDPLTAPTGLITMQEPAWNNSNVYYDRFLHIPGIWSFWQVTRFENAYQFLTQPGQFYLDSNAGWLYYIPRAGEDLATADVELPVLETLIVGNGTPENPIHNIRFEGLTFSYATWMGPSSNDGYVADQSGFLLVGPNHVPNYIGHDPNVVPTPGNIAFYNSKNIYFYSNVFQHLGAVGLQLGTFSQNNFIDSNLFTDISSAAIEISAVSKQDYHPPSSKQTSKNNTVVNNLIRDVAVEYVDAAGIFVGFTHRTTITHNTIVNVPWSGIAMGWGWGLLDKGSFPGLPGAVSGEWGAMNRLTPNGESVIMKNRIDTFLNMMWDGGAIYTTGRQGPNASKGLLIKENVATGKRPEAGGNTFYTDGGSRYITLKKNVSYDNPIGITFFGPPPQQGDPLPYTFIPSLGNGEPYGSDSGGCVTYGDIKYIGNYWLEAPIPQQEVLYNQLLLPLLGFAPYRDYGFFDICPYVDGDVSYPVNLKYKDNVNIGSISDVPRKLISHAGVRKTPPPTISADQWILPPD